MEEETQQLVVESHGVSEKILKEEISSDQSMKEPKVKSVKAKRKLNVNQSLNQDASQNHKLTEYFAVRRSVRKPKTAILEEKQRNLEESVLSGKEDGLQVCFLMLLFYHSISLIFNFIPWKGSQFPRKRAWNSSYSFVSKR